MKWIITGRESSLPFFAKPKGMQKKITHDFVLAFATLNGLFMVINVGNEKDMIPVAGFDSFPLCLSTGMMNAPFRF